MKRPIVGIVGPTATGKTALGIAVCKALSGEVISMDSMQLYRRMDIGTAKPGMSERGGVAHHMLDILEPWERFSAAAYREAVLPLIDSLHARDSLPVLVGGTGLYLNSVTLPMAFAGAMGDEAVRARLQAVADTGEAGKAALYAQLQACDADTATRLHPNDVRRVIRALEIHETTGAPMSAQRDALDVESQYNTCLIGLTMAREHLYKRTDARVEAMLAQGLVEEVAGLLESGVPPHAQAMQAIGYKEITAMLQGQCSYEQAVDTLKRNTRNYAKRQWTWFRRDARVTWFDVLENPDMLTLRVLAHIRAMMVKGEADDA